MDNPLKNLSNGEKIAVGIGGIVVIWFAWKQHQASGSAASSSSAIDPLTGLPASEDNTTDPETGMTYLAEAQEYGSVAAAEQALTGTGIAGSYYGTGGGSYYPEYGDTGADNSNVVQGTTYGSNAAWAQAVEAGLTDIGYTSTDVAAALGRYLGSLSETSAQAAIVQAALAEYGPPPVGSYTIIMAPATTSTGSGNTGTGTSTGTGTTAPAPQKPPVPSGISASAVKPTSAVIGWDAAPGAASYGGHLTYQGAQLASFTTSGTHATVSGLTPDHTYTIHVWSKNAAGQSAESNGPSFKTPKS